MITQQQAHSRNFMRTTLINAGLCDAVAFGAYLGALHVGAGPADAFEAARAAELAMIPEEPFGGQEASRYSRPREYDAAMERLELRRERVRGIPNPFANTNNEAN